MADLWVFNSQSWLNKTYGGVSGFTKIVEDGITGWGTMFALTRALQHELGLSALSDNFGSGTIAAYREKVGTIGASTRANIVGILQCALWCKGYTGGVDFGEWSGIVHVSIADVRSDIGLGSGGVDVKVMKSLLTLDAYIRVGAGTELVRAGQRWLNSRYVGRADYFIVPCDGTFTRDVQRGLMLAIQYELGMADGVANGNFGPGTQAGLKSSAHLSSGSSDGVYAFVSLFQLALAFNTYDVPRTGIFSATTRSATLDFQRFLEISPTGNGDYETWAALLVSTGNPDRAVTGMDTTTALTATTATSRYREGYRVVGRYLTVNGKSIAPGELDVIFAAGLKVIPIFQNFNNGPEYFTRALGLDHGKQAAVRARQLGFKGGTTIFFAVDYDAFAAEIDRLIVPYFQGVAEGLKASVSEAYAIGIYATRNVAAEIMKRGLASAVWVSGMSTGYSGNLGYPMPKDWSYNQIQELHSINIDRNAVSVRARPAARADVHQTPDRDQDVKTYYWNVVDQLVRAEASTVGRSLIGPAAAADFVLAFFMSKKYVGGFWSLYGRPPEASPGLPAATAQQIGLARGAYMADAGSIESASAGYPGDLQHMAATAYSARIWGTAAGSNSVEVGDLGGWALDLVTFWKALRDSGSRDIEAFVRLELGSRNSQATFDEADLVADADGWLLAQGLRAGASLDAALRSQLAVGSGWPPRLKRFLTSRFGSALGLERAIASVFHGTWPWPSVPRDVFLGNTPVPTRDEMSLFSKSCAQRLFSLASE